METTYEYKKEQNSIIFFELLNLHSNNNKIKPQQSIIQPQLIYAKNHKSINQTNSHLKLKACLPMSLICSMVSLLMLPCSVPSFPMMRNLLSAASSSSGSFLAANRTRVPTTNCYSVADPEQDENFDPNFN